MAEQASVVLSPRIRARERAQVGVGVIGPFLVGGLATGLLAADRGGYWPASWGWTGLVLAWVATVGLVVGAGRVSRLELAFAGLLGAFTGWTALSLLWTSSGTQTMLSVERTLVYVLAAAAAAAMLRSASYRSLVWGVWAGATAVCGDGLLTRLLPASLGVVDPIAGNRLEAPVGYWNGLGLLAALAAVLAVGLAARGRAPAARALAAASLPVIVPTLYLTFSRGAWVALAAAIAVALALAPWRLELAVTLLVQGAIAAVALWLVERAKAMREIGVPLDRQVQEGHRLLWQLPLVIVVAAAAAAAQAIVARRGPVPRPARQAFAGALVALLVACVAVVLVRFGGPSGVYRHARSSIEGVAPGGTDLNKRLFSLSSNGRLRQWHVALDEWRAHRALGGGAGTYAQWWTKEHSDEGQILNVHNLYLETLAELGPIGLLLLVAALLMPLVAAVRARRRALVPVAAGAWVAFLVHAAYDWDWQLAGVTIAAVFCAGAVLAAARGRGEGAGATGRRRALLCVAVAAGVVSFLGLLGNRALDQSGNELKVGNFPAAAQQAKDAHRWAPWSSQPWAQLAAVRQTAGDAAGARAAYRQAVSLDPDDWQLWLDLVQVTTGAERRAAIARLAVLDPASAAAFKQAAG